MDAPAGRTYRSQSDSKATATADDATPFVAKHDLAKFGTYLAQKVKNVKKETAHVKSAKDVAKLALVPFPIVGSLATYKPEYAIPDAAAGLVEGILTVPTGLAYALLAYLPAQYGLYTCLMPPIIYMLLGTCKQLSLGSSAIEALFCKQLSLGSSAIEALFLGESVRATLGDEIATSTDPANIAITVQYTLYMSCLVGVWQLVFWIFRLSFVSILLSDPVLSGFCTGGAFVIGTSQLSSLLGVSLGNNNFLPALWAKAINEFDNWNWCAIGMGLSGLVFLFATKYLNRRFLPKQPLPWQILLVVLSIVVTSQMGLDESQNLKASANVVGHITSGFPPVAVPSLPDIPGKNRDDVLAASLLNSLFIALFVFAVFLSLTTSFADRNGYTVQPDRELFALGAATTLSSFFGAFVSGASFSRTAVVAALGARTALHGAAAVLVTVLALTLVTAQLYYLPKCILASIILAALAPLVEFRQGAEYFRVSKPDCLAWLATFALCIFAGAMYGIYGGVALSLLLLVWRSATAQVSTLGRLANTNIYRPLSDFPDGREHTGIKILKFMGALNFANSHALCARVKEAAAEKGIVTVILDAGAITAIDISALRALLELIQALEDKGVKLLMCHWGAPQRKLLERTGFYDRVTPDTLFLHINDAVTFARARAAAAANAPDVLPPLDTVHHRHHHRHHHRPGATGKGAAAVAAHSVAASGLVAVATVTDANGHQYFTAEGGSVTSDDRSSSSSSSSSEAGDVGEDIEAAELPPTPVAAAAAADAEAGVSVNTVELSSGSADAGGSSSSASALDEV
ncbi:sulfate transporter family-domain-containing protein [Tribonema minus]|uniref:Sulfate transporter family-domain-containing protein n=1 Tax=Tribonema minus TaxID=303371 RepID=A0A835Z0R2_9STRA|nr:sulfate transporter family-domain-containing protein [Tribonema minus]